MGFALTAPNALSLSRLGLAVAFVAVPGWRGRLVVLGLATLTDYLDGWLARRTHATSAIGALLDPITDRVFVFAATTTYLVERRLSSVDYFILLSRDIMTAIGFLVARVVPWLKPVRFRARILGKVVTTLQLATLVTVLVDASRVPALVRFTGVVALCSVVDYTMMLWRERDVR